MKPWSVVRAAGPVGIGLALVILRPSWVSVVTLGLLIIVAAWLDTQERRADDIEALGEELRNKIDRTEERITQERRADVLENVQIMAAGYDKHEKMLKEHAARLDAMAQQRKGPIL